MNPFRLWLLVLLAVLIPVRGAVAAAMLCPPAGSVGQMQRAVAEHHPAAAAELMTEQAADLSTDLTIDRPGHDPLQHQHAQGGQHDHQKPSNEPDACNLCAAFCSTTPMLSSPQSVVLPRQVSTASFPDLAAPSPSFVSGGQDRPPRTL